jgi:hypothetical protein
MTDLKSGSVEPGSEVSAEIIFPYFRFSTMTLVCDFASHTLDSLL